MTYVVTEACIGCRYGDCTQVCPQHAFREGPDFVVIDSLACANCALCEMVCPVQAIKAEGDLAPADREYVELNRSYAATWPPTTATPPLPDADEWASRQNKRHLLKHP